MKTTAVICAVTASLAAAALATPTLAQPYGYYGGGYADACQATQHDRGTAGAVLGGLAGALIGSNLASHHSGRAPGAAIGAIAGAVLGNNIGRSTAKSSDPCQARDAYDGYYGPQPARWTYPDYGYQPSPYATHRDVRYGGYRYAPAGQPYGYGRDDDGD